MAASGIISTTQDLWRTMLATCTEFQTWCGVSTLADAKEHIHHDRLPAPASGDEQYSANEMEGYLPFAVVYTDPAGGFELVAEAVGERWEFEEPTGRLYADFYSKDDPASSNPDEDFRNMLGGVLKSDDVNNPGLAELTGTATYLSIERLQAFGPIVVVPEEFPEIGACRHMRLRCDWR